VRVFRRIEDMKALAFAKSQLTMIGLLFASRRVEFIKQSKQ
jgi:hypothetical protein